MTHDDHMLVTRTIGKVFKRWSNASVKFFQSFSTRWSK
jgi:hypothetical protein